MNKSETEEKQKTLGCCQGDSVFDECIWGSYAFNSRHLPYNMQKSTGIMGGFTENKKNCKDEMNYP